MAQEPDPRTADLWPAYLDYFREQIIEQVLGLTAEQRHTSTVPSGWTPIELLSHVLHMERRWLLWGFLGEPVTDVWGDWSGGAADAGKWSVPPGTTAEELADRLRAAGRRTTEILTTRSLDEIAVEGERFDGEPASLAWICFHVLHEYSRHAGHLDIAVELTG